MFRVFSSLYGPQIASQYWWLVMALWLPSMLVGAAWLLG
jgi:hypothetical protein